MRRPPSMRDSITASLLLVLGWALACAPAVCR